MIVPQDNPREYASRDGLREHTVYAVKRLCGFRQPTSDPRRLRFNFLSQGWTARFTGYLTNGLRYTNAANARSVRGKPTIRIEVSLRLSAPRTRKAPRVKGSPKPTSFCTTDLTFTMSL